MKQKVFKLVEKGHIELENVEVPNPKDNEVLIKIKACGLYAKCVGSVKVPTDTIKVKEFIPLLY